MNRREFLQKFALTSGGLWVMKDRIAQAFTLSGGSYLGPAASPYYPVGADCVLYHAYWDGTAVDHSTSGNNGTVLGGGQFVTNGVQLDGVDDYITVAAQSSLYPGTSDFSLFAWVKFPVETNRWSPILQLTRSGAEGFIGMGLHIYTGADWYYRGEAEWFKPPYVNDYLIATGYNQPQNFDTWIFLGYEVDRDVGGYFSRNGVSVAGPTGTTDASVNYQPSLECAIGAGGGLYDAHGAKMIGVLGEVYIFKTFNSSYRSDIFNVTKARYGL